MEKQFLILEIDNEKYGIDIINIQEICHYQPITTIPKANKNIKGVINFRGTIIPIVNTRKYFSIEGETMEDDRTRIIILTIDNKLLGLLSDEASKIIKLEEENIEPVSKSIACHNSIKLIGKHDNDLISIINIESLKELL
jgi:purine-binding chemotaxis protein CheW